MLPSNFYEFDVSGVPADADRLFVSTSVDDRVANVEEFGLAAGHGSTTSLGLVLPTSGLAVVRFESYAGTCLNGRSTYFIGLQSGMKTLSLKLGSLTDCPTSAPAGMVYVPRGAFQVGPAKMSSTTPAFYIDVLEVSASAYQRCVATQGCTRASASITNSFQPQTNVSYAQAEDYCAKQGKRLPDEFEWQKAARGTDGRDYPWGNQTPSCTLAQYESCSGGPVSVAEFTDTKSPYGTLNQAGNVGEWTSTSLTNGYHLVAGGDYISTPAQILTYAYDEWPDGMAADYIGFRCLQDAN